MHLVHIWSVVESIRRSSRENESSLLIEEYSIDNRRSSVEVLIEIINYTINSSISIPRTCLVQILQLFNHRILNMMWKKEKEKEKSLAYLITMMTAMKTASLMQEDWSRERIKEQVRENADWTGTE